MRKLFFFAYAKTKAQISFAVTAKLICAFVSATRIEQFFYFLNPKFQGHLLWLYSPVCFGPGRKPLTPVFSQRGSNYGLYMYDELMMNYLGEIICIISSILLPSLIVFTGWG